MDGWIYRHGPGGGNGFFHWIVLPKDTWFKKLFILNTFRKYNMPTNIFLKYYSKHLTSICTLWQHIASCHMASWGLQSPPLGLFLSFLVVPPSCPLINCLFCLFSSTFVRKPIHTTGQRLFGIEELHRRPALSCLFGTHCEKRCPSSLCVTGLKWWASTRDAGYTKMQGLASCSLNLVITCYNMRVKFDLDVKKWSHL